MKVFVKIFLIFEFLSPILKKKLLIIFLFLFIAANTFAQDKNSHEVGFVLGAAAFTTDYGQRYDFSSNVGGNIGVGIGVVYFFNFTDYRYRWNQRTNYFSEHFRVKAELSYMSAKLNHFGEWVDEDRQTLGADQLRAMHGSSKVVNLGALLEYHIVDIVDFGSRRIPRLHWSPYLSIGLMGNYYNSTMEYDEDLGLFPKWAVPGAVDTSGGFTGSLNMSVGTRYKLGEYSDILIEVRWQYFFSDWVDGLNAKADPANKYNEWVFFPHIGYVYYLN
jgi:hypothetical protein